MKIMFMLRPLHPSAGSTHFLTVEKKSPRQEWGMGRRREKQQLLHATSFATFTNVKLSSLSQQPCLLDNVTPTSRGGTHPMSGFAHAGRVVSVNCFGTLVSDYYYVSSLVLLLWPLLFAVTFCSVLLCFVLFCLASALFVVAIMTPLLLYARRRCCHSCWHLAFVVAVLQRKVFTLAPARISSAYFVHYFAFYCLLYLLCTQILSPAHTLSLTPTGGIGSLFGLPHQQRHRWGQSFRSGTLSGFQDFRLSGFYFLSKL